MLKDSLDLSKISLLELQRKRLEPSLHSVVSGWDVEGLNDTATSKLSRLQIVPNYPTKPRKHYK
jgi:hypothetical protein